MSNTPRSRVIAAAICLGLVTAALVYVFLSKQEQRAHADVQVVAAKQDIPSGTIVEAGMVEIKSFPQSMLPPAPALTPEMVVNKVAVMPIEAGSAISQRQLASKYRLSHKVPPFMRAVTVALDPIIGVGGFIKPGDHVDVVATFNVNNGTVTKMVLQDVELLATGSELVAEEVDQDSGKQPKPREIPNATLAVTPQDAEKLILAESKGRLRLMLRRSDDASFVSTRGVTGRALLGTVPPDVPEKKAQIAGSSAPSGSASAPPIVDAPLPFQVEPMPAPGAAAEIETGKKIEVIRGTKVEEAVVSE